MPPIPISPNGEATAAASPSVAMMNAAADARQRKLQQVDLENKYKSDEEARMQQQSALANAREQHLQTQDQNAASTHAMANDLGQWQDPATPQYRVPWDQAPTEVRSHVQQAFPNVSSAAPKVWNDAYTANTGNAVTTRVAPTTAQKLQAAQHGVTVDPQDSADDLVAKVTQAQQTAATAKAGGAQDKNDLMTWRTIVRGNPTSQTVAKNLSTAERNLESINANLSGTPNAMSDNNAISAFMGIEKPGVSPTDADRRAATDTAGWWDKLKLHLSNVTGNEALKLTPNQRAQMRVAANTAVEAYRQEYRKHAYGQIQEAISRGLDPNKVIGPGVYNPQTGAINVPQDPRAIFGEDYDQSGAGAPPPAQWHAQQSSIPPAAIQHLQQHPELVPYFEQKYGKGSSTNILTPQRP